MRGFLMEGHIYFMLTTLAYGAEGLHISAFIKVGIGYQTVQFQKVWNLKQLPSMCDMLNGKWYRIDRDGRLYIYVA